MPGGVTYGKDYVPWGSYVRIGDAQVTNGNGVFGAWTTISSSAEHGFYPTTVTVDDDNTATVFEVGYGPAGAERTIAAGLANIPLTTTDFIPKGSRVVVRRAENAAGTSRWTGVSGLRADKWGPDPTVVGPKHQAVTPSLESVTASTSSAQLSAALPYPFVLTTVFASGLTGAASGQEIQVRAGAAGSDVPIVSFTVARPDNLGQGVFFFSPHPLPVAAGKRLAAWCSFGSALVNVAGYRLDY